MTNKKPILIVQGALFGSEAKGAIAGHLCTTRQVAYAVRTGATNAGHTVIYKGKPVKLQQLPVGFVNPDTALVIGAGALIDPEILVREVRMLTGLTGRDITKQLYIDPRAGLHTRDHARRSAESGRHHTMGATGKGCSEALVDRIKGRGYEGMLFGDWLNEDSEGTLLNASILDTEHLLNDAYDAGEQILLEGTQGQLLDLYLGPYPYVTHKQTGPAQWMLECGLSPALQTEIVAVVRTYPIRVAGNSGPMPEEISWPVLARQINAKRELKGMPLLVKYESIQIFEEAVAQVTALGKYLVPAGSTGLDQHLWDADQRVVCKEALSEIYTEAWKAMPASTQADLSNLFELTTVTKKLRRIAAISHRELAHSCRQMRPHWVALTFANYVWPEWWYAESNNNPWLPKYFDEPYVQAVEASCGAPVRVMTWGPGPEHIIERR